MEKIKNILCQLYGFERGTEAFLSVEKLLNRFNGASTEVKEYFNERDITLITYADSIIRPGQRPLQTLSDFLGSTLAGVFSTVHILPFFPYSSDDGFSVTDYLSVDSRLGSWNHITRLSKNFKLMVDLVLNHVSAQSQWFKNYLAEMPDFKHLAIEVDVRQDFSRIVRPRSLPVHHKYKKESGQEVTLWTTFSRDQIDLNYANVKILLKIIAVLLTYISKGISIIRLDAIAYLWKKIGSTCIHLPETHLIVKLFRAILNRVKPEAVLVTETNVPHAENISYFGNGLDEAQMVYNFSLPPLLLYSYLIEDAGLLSQWAGSLTNCGQYHTFLNFTASHDGIGVRPLEGIVSEEKINLLVDAVKSNQGNVSMRRNSNGSEKPYELNITYIDALARKDRMGVDPLLVSRFLSSQAIALVLPGVPAIYIHSLLGTRNWLSGVEQTGLFRAINRQKLHDDNLLAELEDPGSFRHSVFYPYLNLLRVRRCTPAFHPQAPFAVLNLSPRILAVKRGEKDQAVYALTNISSRVQDIPLVFNKDSGPFYNLLSGEKMKGDSYRLKPYEFVWLTSN